MDATIAAGLIGAGGVAAGVALTGIGQALAYKVKRGHEQQDHWRDAREVLYNEVLLYCSQLEEEVKSFLWHAPRPHVEFMDMLRKLGEWGPLASRMQLLCTSPEPLAAAEKLLDWAVSVLSANRKLTSDELNLPENLSLNMVQALQFDLGIKYNRPAR